MSRTIALAPGQTAAILEVLLFIVTAALIAAMRWLFGLYRNAVLAKKGTLSMRNPVLMADFCEAVALPFCAVRRCIRKEPIGLGVVQATLALVILVLTAIEFLVLLGVEECSERQLTYQSKFSDSSRCSAFNSAWYAEQVGAAENLVFRTVASGFQTRFVQENIDERDEILGCSGDLPDCKPRFTILGDDTEPRDLSLTLTVDGNRIQIDGSPCVDTSSSTVLSMEQRVEENGTTSTLLGDYIYHTCWLEDGENHRAENTIIDTRSRRGQGAENVTFSARSWATVVDGAAEAPFALAVALRLAHARSLAPDGDNDLMGTIGTHSVLSWGVTNRISQSEACSRWAHQPRACSSLKWYAWVTGVVEAAILVVLLIVGLSIRIWLGDRFIPLFDSPGNLLDSAIGKFDGKRDGSGESNYVLSVVKSTPEYGEDLLGPHNAPDSYTLAWNSDARPVEDISLRSVL